MDPAIGVSDNAALAATNVDFSAVPVTDTANSLSVAENLCASDPEKSMADGGSNGAQSPLSVAGVGKSNQQLVADMEANDLRTDDATDSTSGNDIVPEETHVKRVSTDGMMREVGIGKENIAFAADEAEIAQSSEENIAEQNMLNASDKNEMPTGRDTKDNAIDDILDDDAVAGVDSKDTDDKHGSLEKKVALPPKVKSSVISIKTHTHMNKSSKSITPRAKTPTTKRSPGSTDLTDRLYAMGMEVKKRRDEMSKIEPEVGPFSPQLATKGRESDVHEPTKQQVFSRLYEESKLKQMRDEERREAAAAAAEAELYVSPSNRKKISAKKATEMYERSMKMKAEAERKRLEIASSVKHPFSPDLQKKGRSRGRDSSRTRSAAPERLYSSDHLRRRDERLEAAKSVKELEGCTFSPRLVTRRRNSGANDTAVYNRLYNKATSKKEVTYLEEGTFAPDITSSQRKVKASRSRLSVHERLHARAGSVSPDKALKNRGLVEASPRRAKSGKSGSRIGQLYGKGVLKAQTELIAAQEEKRLEAKSTGDEETIEFQTDGLDVSLLDMESPKGKDQPCSDENADPALNSKSSGGVPFLDTPKKHEYNTIDSSAKGKVQDIPQAYESGINVGNGAKETIEGPRNEMPTPGSVIGLGPRSSESVGSIEFASI